MSTLSRYRRGLQLCVQHQTRFIPVRGRQFCQKCADERREVIMTSIRKDFDLDPPQHPPAPPKSTGSPLFKRMLGVADAMTRLLKVR